MPYTMDGIGTMYYGKRNVSSHQGVCEFCGKHTTLSCYDTSLFFVIIYIPVIPLGRKRVINYCSLCRKHRVMPLNEYTQLSEDSVEEALSRFHADPDNKQLAFDALDTLFSLNKNEEADEFMASIEERFSHDAELLFKYAAYLERSGEKVRSDEYFLKAFHADPEYKPARRAMGMIKIEEENLQEAESLLKDFLNPEEDFDRSVVYLLAQKHKDMQDPQKALHYYNLLITHDPSSAQDRKIRSEIKQCEKDTKVIDTILPRAHFKCWPLWLKGALIIGVILIALYGVNIVLMMNARVWVVNGYGKNLSISIDGGEEITIAPHSKKKFAVGEGPHNYKFKGATQEVINDEIRYALYDRFFSKPVYIINPGGIATFIFEHTDYVPEGSYKDTNYYYKIVWGEPIIKYDDIDYRFKKFPDTITLDGNSSGVSKTRFSEMNSDPIGILQLLQREKKFTDKDALRFLELCLASNPENRAVIRLYLGYVEYLEEFQRAKEYLTPYLTVEPLVIELHKAYQTVAQSTFDEMRNLRSYYDTFLAQNKKKSNYYYLRARIENYGNDIFPYVSRGLSEDPHNIFLLNLSAYTHLFRGDFLKAQEAIHKADSLSSPHNETIAYTLWYISLATKEWKKALHKVKEERKKSVFDYNLLLRELTLHYNMDNALESKRVIENWKAKQAKKAEQEGWNPEEYFNMLDVDVAILSNDFSHVKEMNIADEKSKNFQPHVAFCYYIAHNQLDKAEKLFATDDILNKSAYAGFELFLAYALHNKMNRGIAYFDKATSLLEHSKHASEREIAHIITHNDYDRLQDLITDDIEIKALVAAAMGIREKSKARQKKYYTLAGLYNIVRNFRYHLIKKVCAS